MKYGLENYNDECRAIVRSPQSARVGRARPKLTCLPLVVAPVQVMRYSGEWKETVERMGRWIDFEKDYKTLDPTYMESVWWVFGQLFEKGLVYQGVKVMPFSTGCTTPVSNFEAGLDYRDVSDPAGTSRRLPLSSSISATRAHATRSCPPPSVCHSFPGVSSFSSDHRIPSH